MLAEVVQEVQEESHESQSLPDKKCFEMQSVQAVAESLHFEQGEVHGQKGREKV